MTITLLISEGNMPAKAWIDRVVYPEMSDA